MSINTEALSLMDLTSVAPFTEDCFFLVQAMLPEGFPFHQFNSTIFNNNMYQLFLNNY